jgi:hypothetical protein
MILRVDLEHFASAVRRVLSLEEAWLARAAGGVVVSAGDPARRIIIFSRPNTTGDEARRILEEAGLQVHEGEWRLGEDTGEAQEFYIAAVSYVSREPKPGLWIDAYEAQPTTAQVLKAMYEEFQSTGEVGGASFEEFVRLANPNVVVVAPEQLQGFLAEKRERLTS